MNWILLLIGIVVILIGVVFCYLFLVLYHKFKLNRLRRKYNAEENKSGRGIVTDIKLATEEFGEGIGTIPEPSIPTPIAVDSKESGTEQSGYYDRHFNDDGSTADNSGRAGKVEGRDKPTDRLSQRRKLRRI